MRKSAKKQQPQVQTIQRTVTGTNVTQDNGNVMIFYCGLMVHNTEKRAQKVFICTSAHITETVLAHDQHWEEQISSSSPQLYHHSQKHRKWITIQ